MVAPVDEDFETGWLVPETHRARRFVLMLAAFAVPALERLDEVTLTHLGVAADELAHHDDDVARVLVAAPVGGHALDAVATPFAREEVGCTSVTRQERPLARPSLLGLNRDGVLGGVD